MVRTRKKDYGEPPLKKRRPAPTQENAIMKSDAAAAVGDGNQDESEKSHAEKQGPCWEFPLFPKLPCELRLMIWKHSMTPRLVAVGPNTIGAHRLQHSRKILPAQLSVNYESRECALRRYNLRFTITVTADSNGNHRWDCPNFRGIKHHANVVMSPDDTLGLFSWASLWSRHGWKFQVENANGTSPWDSQSKSMTFGVEPEVKKVALLGDDLAFNARIVHDLNSTVSWDLDTILHKRSYRARKLCSPSGPWYNSLDAAYTKDYVIIFSGSFQGSLQEWCERRIHVLAKGPDIQAFKVGKKLFNI